jgi:5-formyltetrahydrofolate cyclo-ligase
MVGARPATGKALQDAKRTLRAGALRRRRSVDPTELEEISTEVGRNLLSVPEFQQARLVVSYCALKDEVQTRWIIERALSQGKRVAVVVTHPATKTLGYAEIGSFEDDLEPGTMGIPEPKRGRGRSDVSLEDADVVLVPLVAWDERGNRLGYGAGYFDRALKGVEGVTKVGLAMESQRLAAVPAGPGDIPMDIIVTEKRVLRLKKKAFKKRTRDRNGLHHA